VKPVRTLVSDPSTSSASASTPSLDARHSPTPFFARRTGLHRCKRNLAQRASFPRLAKRRSWGPRPSQVCSRIRVDIAVQARRLSVSHARHSLSAAFLPVRAHVSFAPPIPTRLIFVGPIDRLFECFRKSDRSRMRRRRLLGFNSRLRSASAAFAPKTDPALGFASCRVVGTNECIQSGTTPIESPASGEIRPHARPSSPIRSWASGEPS
jgi:hypothetical protein